MTTPRSLGQRLVTAADLAGTFVFAVEGAMVAVRGDLDFFGVIVLSFATAVGGGIIRDVLLGDTPPAALRTWHYAAIAGIGGAIGFLLFWDLHRVPPWIIIGLDAAGLSLFAVAGTGKALDHRMQPVVAVLLGTITGVGGGTIRDMLLATVPVVLRADVYATAAMAGAVVMVAGRALRWPVPLAGSLGAVVCFTLRVVAVWQGWSLPHVALP